MCENVSDVEVSVRRDACREVIEREREEIMMCGWEDHSVPTLTESASASPSPSVSSGPLG